MLSGMNKLTYYLPANALGTAFLVVFLLVAFRKYAKSDDYITKVKPIRFMFWFLALLEIGKIIYHIAYNKTWSPKAFPIIYCSIAMYVYALIGYGKKDSLIVRVAMFNSIVPFIIIGLLYWVSFPNIDWGNVSLFGYIMNMHSRLYHFANLAISFYVIGSRIYKFDFKDWLPCALANAGYFVLATILSLFIGGEISNFGPNSSELGFFYDFVGYATGNLIIIFLVFIMAYLIFKVGDIIKKAIKKRKSLKQEVESLR